MSILSSEMSTYQKKFLQQHVNMEPLILQVILSFRYTVWYFYSPNVASFFLLHKRHWTCKQPTMFNSLPQIKILFEIMKWTLPRVVITKTHLRFKNEFQKHPANYSQQNKTNKENTVLTAATVSMSNTLVQYRQALAFPYLVWHSSIGKKS